MLIEKDYLCDRWVQWPGSCGWFFVIQCEGTAASGRMMWKCLSPRGTILDVMIPPKYEQSRKINDRPREVELFLESEGD